jgi:hypothetical protein
MDNLEKFAFIPYQKLDELFQLVRKIEEKIDGSSSNSKNSLGEYINESEAKQMLQKGTTWFWNKRKSGELKGKKAGNNWYYQRKDIIKFIESGSTY